MPDSSSRIERRVYSSYWNDGLLDVLAALGVLVIGLFWMADVPIGAAVAPALLVPLWAPLRQRFIQPRLGMVEFSDARERKNKNRLWLAVMLGAASLVLGVAVYFMRDKLFLDPAVSLIAGLPALLLAVLAVLTALLVSSTRFLAYAAILGVAGGFGAGTGWEPGMILVSAGIPIVVIAIVVLVRFFRNSPVVSAPE